MLKDRLLIFCLMGAFLGVGYLLGSVGDGDFVPEAVANSVPNPQAAQVFELRTYTAAEGKFEDLLARFRDHTLEIFVKHDMTSVGYWTPQDAPLSENTLIYLLAHPSREAAEQAWRDFGADPEWQRVAEESRRDGRLIANLERVYLNATDFSPMR